MNESREMQIAASTAYEAAGLLGRHAREAREANDALSWTLQSMKEERVALEAVMSSLHDYSRKEEELSALRSSLAAAEARVKELEGALERIVCYRGGDSTDGDDMRSIARAAIRPAGEVKP